MLKYSKKQKLTNMNADKELTASGMACVTLTPSIKLAISSMQRSEVLKVFNDDPASRQGIPAWCRLTGHTLIEVKELNASDTIFYIQKKNN
jgi:TusA-related sulfurtransferase